MGEVGAQGGEGNQPRGKGKIISRPFPPNPKPQKKPKKKKTRRSPSCLGTGRGVVVKRGKRGKRTARRGKWISGPETDGKGKRSNSINRIRGWYGRAARRLTKEVGGDRGKTTGKPRKIVAMENERGKWPAGIGGKRNLGVVQGFWDGGSTA